MGGAEAVASVSCRASAGFVDGIVGPAAGPCGGASWSDDAGGGVEAFRGWVSMCASGWAVGAVLRSTAVLLGDLRMFLLVNGAVRWFGAL